MIVIIGANAAINRQIIPFLGDSEVIVIGRSEPEYFHEFKETGKDIKFYFTDYSNANKVLTDLSDTNSVSVIFAGIFSTPALIIDLNSEKIRNELISNLEFSILVTTLLLPKMISSGFGRFIFLGSKESSRGVPGGGMYSIIKEAQSGLSRTIAVEYAKFGITSNVLRLGLLAKGYSEKLPKKEIDKLRTRIPTSEILSYKDIANQILVLIKSPSINGAIIDIDQATR